MKIEFTNVGPAGFDIWAATVGNYRINVFRSHTNLNNQTFVFEMILAADDFSDIAAKGFGADLESTLYKAVVKAQELAETSA
jgi:hypothetical protein